MQSLGLEIIKVAQKEKTMQLEAELKDIVSGNSKGEMFVCPICNYVSSKNKKGTAKMFDDSFKCFACGIWRKV